MHFKILGTSAAEGWPAEFCKCEYCRKAQTLGGKNIRTRASCIIDDVLLMDFGPDSYFHKLHYNLDYSKLNAIILTHSHSDHFVPNDLVYKNNGYAYSENNEKLYIFGNEKCEKKYSTATEYEMPQNNLLKFVCIKPYETFDFNGYKITPLLANHDKREDCYIYIIKKDGKTLLYGHDSGLYRKETWDEIYKNNFNAVILDGTMGMLESCYGHMNFNENIKVRETMIKNKCADSNTIFITTHFSHNIALMHNEIEKIMCPHGFTVAYDGIEINI